VKLTFEGPTLSAILEDMAEAICDIHAAARQTKKKFGLGEPSFEAQGPSPEPVPDVVAAVDKPVETPVDKLVEEKPFAKKMREAKAAKATKPKLEPKAVPVGPPPVEKPPLDVNEIIKLRQRTIMDLQEAYADGRQKEVFALLDRFGNGAKSFRELTAESFLPIREAIDAGALK